MIRGLAPPLPGVMVRSWGLAPSPQGSWSGDGAVVLQSTQQPQKH